MITRPNVRQSSSLLVDLGVVALLSAVLYGLMSFSKHWSEPLQAQIEIHLSLWALPGYTVLSLLRGLVAYGFSLVFALTYGYVAASSARAERLLIPLLDVLQSIPVLGFLPAAVLALVALFPRTNIGLELASVLMIATGQVWNLAFSFYQSLRSLPAELREASSVYQFNWWQRFRRVELPAATVGLAWNSMMAMAGGWFFLMVCEAFTLGARDFRLPGLGAYMSTAVARHAWSAMAGGILAMVLMIVAIDTCLWRPVLVWAQRFRLEDSPSIDAHGSLILRWMKRSRLVQTAMARIAHPISEWLASGARLPSAVPLKPHATPRRDRLVRAATGLLLGLAALGTAWGAWQVVRLLRHVPWTGWRAVASGSVLTLIRVAAAVVVGTLWTVPVGLWIGRSDRRCKRWQPFVQIAASFPAPVLFPLILLALHQRGVSLGVSASALMLLGTQWYILFNVIAGASSIPEDLRAVTQTYHFTAAQRWRVMWWPGIFPYLLTGWVTAAGGAWNASIVAEYVSVGPQTFTAPGLGSVISVAASQGHYELLAAAVLAMAIVVILLNRYLWKPLYRLAGTRYAY